MGPRSDRGSLRRALPSPRTSGLAATERVATCSACSFERLSEITLLCRSAGGEASHVETRRIERGLDSDTTEMGPDPALDFSSGSANRIDVMVSVARPSPLGRASGPGAGDGASESRVETRRVERGSRLDTTKTGPDPGSGLDPASGLTVLFDSPFPSRLFQRVKA
jgi:hypothetical protein